MQWKLDKPTVAQWHEWDEWAQNTKAAHPIRYFLQETVPGWWSGYTFHLNRLYWKVLHRFHPKHHYHVIKPRSLEPGYHDPDVQILYACMDTFAVYFETGAIHVDWTGGEESRKTHGEMVEIYNWWKYDWPHSEDLFRVDGTPRIPTPELPEAWGTMAAINPKYADTPEVAAWRKAAETSRKDDADWAAKEEEMLCRLMKIRPSLWYL